MVSVHPDPQLSHMGKTRWHELYQPLIPGLDGEPQKEVVVLLSPGEEGGACLSMP